MGVDGAAAMILIGGRCQLVASGLCQASGRRGVYVWKLEFHHRQSMHIAVLHLA